MQAYSNELRERVAAACAAPGATHMAVAARFCVWVSFVEKLYATPAGEWVGSRPAPLLNPAAQAELEACLRQQPHATLNKLCVWVAALGGPAVKHRHDGAGGAHGWTGGEKKERSRRRT